MINDVLFINLNEFQIMTEILIFSEIGYVNHHLYFYRKIKSNLDNLEDRLSKKVYFMRLEFGL